MTVTTQDQLRRDTIEKYIEYFLNDTQGCTPDYRLDHCLSYLLIHLQIRFPDAFSAAIKFLENETIKMGK